MSEYKMPDVNHVIIAGNLTKDPVIRSTTNGTPVANFTIACNRKFRDNTGNWREDVCYIWFVAWYKLAEICHGNLQKGSAVIIDGELQSRSWKTEDGHFKNIVEIKARRIQFLNKKDTSEDISEISTYEDSKKEPELYDNMDKEEEIEEKEENKQDDIGQGKKDESFDFGYDNLKLWNIM